MIDPPARGVASVATTESSARLDPSGATASRLDRRARRIAERAEDAAVARLRLQQRAAARAVVEVDAGVGGHGLGSLMAAARAGQHGRRLHPVLLEAS